MVWILNIICSFGCFCVLIGTLQLIHHDLFTRYTTGIIEGVSEEALANDQTAMSNVTRPGRTYHVSYVNPRSGIKYESTWNVLALPEGSKKGDETPVAYATNKPESVFGPGYRGSLEINARNLFIVGILCLIFTVMMRLWLVGKL